MIFKNYSSLLILSVLAPVFATPSTISKPSAEAEQPSNSDRDLELFMGSFINGTSAEAGPSPMLTSDSEVVPPSVGEVVPPSVGEVVPPSVGEVGPPSVGEVGPPSVGEVVSSSESPSVDAVINVFVGITNSTSAPIEVSSPCINGTCSGAIQFNQTLSNVTVAVADNSTTPSDSVTINKVNMDSFATNASSLIGDDIPSPAEPEIFLVNPDQGDSQASYMEFFTIQKPADLPLSDGSPLLPLADGASAVSFGIGLLASAVVSVIAFAF